MLIVPVLAVALAQSSPPGRGLTPGERAFLAPLFRDAVDYEAIRIVRGRAFPMQGSRTVVAIRDIIYSRARSTATTSPRTGPSVRPSWCTRSRTCGSTPTASMS